MDFVLIHGAFHGAWCWDRLIPEIASRGDTALAVDLPIADPRAGAVHYARTVVDAISELNSPVVVAHSMSGVVLPLIADATPVAKMVFLAAFIPEPGSSLADQRSREPIDPDLAEAEFTEIGDGVYTLGVATATEMFYQDATPELAQWAIDRLRPQAYRFMYEVTPLETWPAVDSAYILCRDDHAINPAWCRRAARDRLGITAHEVDGGHSPFLTRPAELADLLHEIGS